MKYKSINVEIDGEEYTEGLLLTKKEIHALFDLIGNTSMDDRRKQWGISLAHSSVLSKIYQQLRVAYRGSDRSWIDEKEVINYDI